MREVVLQDWTTLLHTAGTGAIIMNADQYLDTSAYQDAVAWLETKAITPASISVGNPLLVNVETAPVKEEAFFKPLYSFSISGSPPTPGVSVGKATLRSLQLATTPPICAWTRWRVVESGAAFDWSLTFRIVLSLNSMCM